MFSYFITPSLSRGKTFNNPVRSAGIHASHLAYNPELVDGLNLLKISSFFCAPKKIPKGLETKETPVFAKVSARKTPLNVVPAEVGVVTEAVSEYVD